MLYKGTLRLEADTETDTLNIYGTSEWPVVMLDCNGLSTSEVVERLSNSPKFFRLLLSLVELQKNGASVIYTATVLRPSAEDLIVDFSRSMATSSASYQ